MNGGSCPGSAHRLPPALHTGKKFMVPFDVIVVFSSNLPALAAGGRCVPTPLGYKIFVGALEEPEYRRIFMQNCKLHIPFREEGYQYLLRHTTSGQVASCVLPRDILCQLRIALASTIQRQSYRGIARLGLGQLFRAGLGEIQGN
jgi:hypothetical protein